MKGHVPLTLSAEAWDLYRKAEEDQAWHQRRVREAIQKNLVDLLNEESIVLSEGSRVIRVPIQSLAEHRFRFEDGEPGNEGRSSGTGPASQGGSVDGPGGRTQGGDQPGCEDLTETEVTLETADQLVFEGLELPGWDAHRHAPGVPGGQGPQSIERVGMRANLHARATLKAALRHRQTAPRLQLLSGDLRYRTLSADPSEEAGAVVLAMMDTSGSMGTFEKYMARSFFFWAVRFLRTRYPHVQVVFLAHDVRAREVDEETFFHRGASGGTVSSSVYRLAREILAARFQPERYNAYAFHFTDGGNLTSDNPQALVDGAALAAEVNLFGYGEIHDTTRNPSPLFQGFGDSPHTRAVVLRSKADVMQALSLFFREAPGEEESAHARA
jgi:sporulation protein YhbH